MRSISQNIRSIVDHDGGVILDFEHDAMITLNSTGAYVWEKLREGKLINDIVRELAAQSGADPANVDRDVCAFLDQLKRKHLLTA